MEGMDDEIGGTDIKYAELKMQADEWGPTQELAWIPTPGQFDKRLCQLWRERKTGMMQWRPLRMVDANIGQTYHHGYRFVEFT